MSIPPRPALAPALGRRYAARNARAPDFTPRTAKGPTVAGDIDWASFARTVWDSLSRYVEASSAGTGSVLALAPAGAISEELELERWKQGGMDAGALAGFLERYLSRTTRLHHPGYIAHQVAVPALSSALADLVNGVVNNGTSIYEMGAPGAVIESAMIGWMLEKVGWPRGAGGVLTHGGALANLTALAAARSAIAPSAWEEGVPRDLAVIAAPTCHYSIARAVALLGLGARRIVPLACDAVDRVLPRAVAAAHEQVRSEGRRVMAVVISAGATATGLHDPVRAAGEYCRREGLWLHVDAAHGGSALLSERERHWLDGIELADSLVWDAHKMLRASNLCAAVLLRDREVLDGALRLRATYMIRGDGRGGLQTARRSIECTKNALGLKLFLNLACFGERGLAEHVERLYENTRRFHAIIGARAGFECPYPPESNILCFRHGTDDELQDRIRTRLLEEGRFHISAADVRGARHLRLTVMNPRTSDATIRALLDRIAELAAVA